MDIASTHNQDQVYNNTKTWWVVICIEIVLVTWVCMFGLVGSGARGLYLANIYGFWVSPVTMLFLCVVMLVDLPIFCRVDKTKRAVKVKYGYSIFKLLLALAIVSGAIGALWR
jgi:hypothetical protein